MSKHRLERSCKGSRLRPIYDWVNSTGIDGISHAVAADSAWEKCAWFIIAVVRDHLQMTSRKFSTCLNPSP